MNKSMWNNEAVKAYESGQGVVLVEKPYPHYEPVAKFHVEHRTNACSEVCYEKGKVYATCDLTTEANKRAQLICDLLNTTPPQRTWVGLTDEDELDWEEGGNLKDLVKAIEAKLKAKNS
jgi:hypothetical protein